MAQTQISSCHLAELLFLNLTLKANMLSTFSLLGKCQKYIHDLINKIEAIED